ncbi:MAG: pyridoxal-dependent decarboxylase [Candidatus Kapaibacterium sp.]
MNSKEFKKYGREIIDFIADYLENTEQYPVKTMMKPGDIKSKIKSEAPEIGEPFSKILEDFNEVILPGLTHWQSPNFFAYFSSNNSYESILGELLASGLGVNAFSWETSPSATELEEMMMLWLRNAVNLSDDFTGVIQDTASVSTLCSILTAREKRFRDFPSLRRSDIAKFRVYCSEEAHSSIERAVIISGIGRDNCIKISLNADFSMDSSALEVQILEDIRAGLIPLCVVSAVGTTGSLAIDPVEEIGVLASKYQIWHHVDAAYSGNAFILDEYKHLAEAVSCADTIVFNPHKWIFINFDFSAYFVKDTEALISTFEIIPEYLKTTQGNTVNNYRDWGVQLGRRFRALKAWFVLRGMGLEQIRRKLRHHIYLAGILHELIQSEPDFEIIAPLSFNLVCFRYKPSNIYEVNAVNQLNINLLNKLNDSGKIYLTKTKLQGKITLRMVTGTVRVDERNVLSAWELIRDTARNIPR